jgi:hypothetical protein
MLCSLYVSAVLVASLTYQSWLITSRLCVIFSSRMILPFRLIFTGPRSFDSVAVQNSMMLGKLPPIKSLFAPKPCSRRSGWFHAESTVQLDTGSLFTRVAGNARKQEAAKFRPGQRCHSTSIFPEMFLYRLHRIHNNSCGESKTQGNVDVHNVTKSTRTTSLERSAYQYKTPHSIMLSPVMPLSTLHSPANTCRSSSYQLCGTNNRRGLFLLPADEQRMPWVNHGPSNSIAYDHRVRIIQPELMHSRHSPGGIMWCLANAQATTSPVKNCG